jgi:receptor expression-enhancing protein 5/6
MCSLHKYSQDKTKIPKEFLVVGGGVLLAIFFILGMGIAPLTSIVGFLYPAYKSFQAIEQKNKNDDTQWLVYWVIFAFFSIAETFIDYLLYWIPFYYAFKVAFLLWAMLPQTRGAKLLYDNFLRDFLKKNESRIDAAFADAKKSAGAVASEFAAAGNDIANNVAKSVSKESKKAS